MSKFQVMLASGTPKDLDKLDYPIFISPKLDGRRAFIEGGVVFSRNGKPIPNAKVQEKFGDTQLNGLDGELMVGSLTDPAAFRKSGKVTKIAGSADDVTFNVFDHIGPRQFHERFDKARDIAAHQDIVVVPHYICTRADDVIRLETQFVDQGYEGGMLRSPTGPYKSGRATEREGFLMKLKRFADSEAVIIDYWELEHNENEKTLVGAQGKAKRSSKNEGKRLGGVLGTLQVRDIESGVAFSVGSGFTAEERYHLWRNRRSLAGKIIKYKFFPGGSKDKPRFPTFLGFVAGAGL